MPVGTSPGQDVGRIGIDQALLRGLLQVAQCLKQQGGWFPGINRGRKMLLAQFLACHIHDDRNMAVNRPGQAE